MRSGFVVAAWITFASDRWAWAVRVLRSRICPRTSSRWWSGSYTALISGKTGNKVKMALAAHGAYAPIRIGSAFGGSAQSLKMLGPLTASVLALLRVHSLAFGQRTHALP